MSMTNTRQTLDALFKEVYADKISMNVPVSRVVQKEVKFLAREKSLGNKFHVPVVLAHEHGVTFADPNMDDVTLEDAVAGVTKDAVVDGYQMFLRSRIGINAAARAIQSKNAFEDVTRFVVGNMLDSLSKKLEIELLYGQSGIGEVHTGGTGTSVNVVIKESEWAPGIWVGAEGMKIDFYTGATLNCSGTVSAVNFDTRTITVSFSSSQTVVANDVIYFKGAYGKEMPGIHKILTNNSTLFGINAASHALWKGTSYAPASPSVLTFPILQQAIAQAMPKGLEDDLLVLVNPAHWDDLLVAESNLRRYDSSYSPEKAVSGAKAIEFHSQNGIIQIVSSPYVKQGYAYALAKQDWHRIGATDITFKRPGMEGNFFRELENSTGYELRAYTIQSIFCAAPARSIIISNLKPE